LLVAAALAATAAGCSSSIFEVDKNSGEGLFSQKLVVFDKTTWGSGASSGTVNLGPSGPVAAEDLVGPDGRCAPPASAEAPAPAPVQAQAAAEPPQPADRRVGSMAGDLAGPPMPAASAVPARLEPESGPGLAPAAPLVAGGVALGMSECQAVRRAGLPSNVSIGASDKGERRTVLTYLGGTWPGIYTFDGGRLKEIARAPEPPKPATPVKKKIVKKKKANTAQGGSTVYVQ
jgi:hypothetical protein